ncbi:ABC transporter substrate-binding protein [Reichenbachiella ulvae]|uniref:ABC transporter substrate-binding protein n=1 Tax=Reichenbachiella ulvae TaxID=2980104 RepID=A0ABT3CNV7_9BACT|nr:ABC transporter substrate-binding protein [Reichenbachiella ulvae]MCV9385304.1 ABC transporter substrate-binding protein [Reichenbachiella ulvae]
MKKYVLILVLTTCMFRVYSQEDRLSQLSMDELLNVNLEKTAQPIVWDQRAKSQEVINLAVMLPSSKFPGFSKELMQAAQLAMDQINASGGVLGKDLNLVLVDDAADLDLCLLQADTLIRRYGVRYIIGPTNSERVIALSKEFEEEDWYLISPSASAIEISNLNDDRVFRTAASDVLQASFATKYAIETLRRRKASLFYIDNAYGQGLAQEFKRKFEERGGQVIAEEYYSPLVDLQTYDITQKIEALISDGPDLIYLVSNHVDIELMAPKIQMPDDVIILATDAAKGEYGTVAANVLDGMIGTSSAFTTQSYFLDSYKIKYGTVPTFLESADVYDIVYLYAGAILTSAVSDESIHQSLQDFSMKGAKMDASHWSQIIELISRGKKIDFIGSTGSLDFLPNGDIQDRSIEVWELDAGDILIK